MRNSVILAIIAIFMAIGCSKKNDSSGPNNGTQDQSVVFNINTNFPGDVQITNLNVKLVCGTWSQTYPITAGVYPLTLSVNDSKIVNGKAVDATLSYSCASCITVSPGATISIPVVGTSNELNWRCSPCTVYDGVEGVFSTSFPSGFVYSGLGVVIYNLSTNRDTIVMISSPADSTFLPGSFAEPGQDLDFEIVFGPSVLVIRPNQYQEIKSVGKRQEITWTMTYTKK